MWQGTGTAEISRASNHGLNKMVAWSPSDDSILKVEYTGVLVGGVRQAVGSGREEGRMTLISNWNNRGDGIILTKMGKPVEKQVWRKLQPFKRMPHSLSHWNNLDPHLVFLSTLCGAGGGAVKGCLV